MSSCSNVHVMVISFGAPNVNKNGYEKAMDEEQVHKPGTDFRVLSAYC